MLDFYSLILSAFYNFGFWGYLLIALIALLESVVFLGVVFPGTAIIFALGFLSSHDVLSVKYLIIAGIIGGIIGDWVSYFLGSKGIRFFADDSKIFKQSHIDRAQEYFEQHGGKSIFISKFIGFFRGVVAFVAGLSKMKKLNFGLWSIVGNIISVTLCALGGFFFGEFFVYFEIWSKRIGITLSVLVLIGFLIWFRKRRSQEIERVREFIKKNIEMHIGESMWWNKTKTSVLYLFLRKRLNIKKVSGLFSTSLTLILLSHVLAFTSFIDTILNSRVVLLFDRYSENFFVFQREVITTDIMRWVTMLFDLNVFFGLVLIFGLVLLLLEERLYAISLWISSLFLLSSIYILKLFIDRGRPLVETLMLSGSDASFPSGHSAAAVFFVGFIVYILFKEKLIKRKAVVYISSIGVVFLVGISRIYLGLHFATDVAAGFFIGLLWFLLVISILEILHKRFKFVKVGEIKANYIKNIIAFLLVTLSVFGFLYYGNNKIKEADEYIKGEKFQTNPRFVENI